MRERSAAQRRNYSQATVTSYIKTVADFARYFQRPPDQLGPDDPAVSLYLLNERKQEVRTVGNHTAALRFFFCKTLKPNYPIKEVLPHPRVPRKLPVILMISVF